MNQNLDIMRHQALIDPSYLDNTKIDIIGAGATGSFVAFLLAKIGFDNIRVSDFDIVEAHNVCNQLYGIGDVGKPKVEALKERIFRDTGTEIQTRQIRVDKDSDFGNIVFVLTDTMESRREISETVLKNPDTDVLIETRMGTRIFYLFTVVPSHDEFVRKYEESLYSDAETERSACGTVLSLGPTAFALSAFTVNAFVQWILWIKEKVDKPHFMKIFNLDSLESINICQKE